MIYRMSAAFLSLAGLFISGYLYLYKIGKIGSLACGTGGCETVQLSSWSRIAGLEVSLIGVLGYAVLLGLSLLALQPRLVWQRWPVTVIALLAALGLVFTGYLTFLEVFVIHAVCRWCVTSALIITLIFVVSWMEHRRLARAPDLE